MFELTHTDRSARRGILRTPHGNIKTPFFMNVATAGAIKGGVSAPELKELKCSVMLCNTYHLHLRPSDEIVRKMGGIRKFTAWDGPLLTDSGGFQVFSLGKLRKISEEGVQFSSHLDGHKVFLSPETSMRIQSNLGSTIAMAFDECVSTETSGASSGHDDFREKGPDYSYFKNSCARTVRWLERSVSEIRRLNMLEDTVNRQQMIFGINQGGVYKDLRLENARQTAEFDIDGFAVGGLAVGEPAPIMYEILDTVLPAAPKEKPRYLMGVGTPQNLLEAVARGIDMFDCVMPTRNARHGTVFTAKGIMHLKGNRFKDDPRPIDEECGCPVCRTFTRAYLRHLFKAEEYLSGRLAAMHNLYFYNNLMETVGKTVEDGTFWDFYRRNVEILGVLRDD